uniref:Uncharacterized protein n=1 Tax=Setaria viridis TaxID=4556 RepID=A0A4U6TEK9_SETVI|nr:hypothetical protein SEVIR_8G123700v2 [Setaria viridis]
MYIVESKGGAIALILVATLCGGSFVPAMLLMERKGRWPQHIYLDYSIANFLVAVLLAVTVGPIGESKAGMPNFFTQLGQVCPYTQVFTCCAACCSGGRCVEEGSPSRRPIGAPASPAGQPRGNPAMVRAPPIGHHEHSPYAGSVRAVCDICEIRGTVHPATVDLSPGPGNIYAWAFVGLSLANIIGCCMSVVLGTTVNYFLDGRINRAEILFPGVACFMVAIVLRAAVHSSNAKDKKEKLNNIRDAPEPESRPSRESTMSRLPPELERNGDCHGQNGSNDAQPGTAEFIAQVEKRRSIKAAGSSTFIGLLIVLFAGFCFFIYSPALNHATNDQWHALKKGVPIIPANSRHRNGRQWGLRSGLLCGFANGFQFMGGQAAGFATADAILASSLICTIWDIVLFGEYRRSSKKTYFLLGTMLSMFIITIAVLLASGGHRKTA